MDRNNEGISLISSILMGTGGGVLTGAIVLFFQSLTLKHDVLFIILSAILVTGILWCFDRVEKRGMNPLLSEGLILSLSYGITMLYAGVVSKNELAWQSASALNTSTHALALLLSVLRWFVRYRMEGKKEQ